MIQRVLEHKINSHFHSGKAIILLGPRQTGKTTLCNKILSDNNNPQTLDCDDPIIREQLENINIEGIKSLIGQAAIVFIDEAQRVKNIGLCLKLFTDHYKHIQLLVSGSSSFDLANEINEPLTGRKWEYFLYPVSWQEFSSHVGYLKSEQLLETRLIYGMYPDIIMNPGKEKELLKQLSSSYLYKDLLSYKGIRKPEIIEKLLRALALQMGSEVSYNELASLIQVDKNTVSSYIDLLEKAFVIFRLQPFRRNLRSEIGSNRKIYFYDNGIRNALISNFNPLSMRQDAGSLWENFLVTERMKMQHYTGIWSNSYFWRTKEQQEIDYIEERDGKLFAYEFKWSGRKKMKITKTFKNAYPESEEKFITKDNFREFIEKKDS